MSSLTTLLNTNPGESAIQSYFESQPQAFVATKHVLGNTVISKLPIGNDFICDLAYVEPQSGRTYLHLVELEAPTKAIFTKDGQFTADFNQALQQVTDWLYYVERNKEVIRDLLEPLRAPTGADILHYTAVGHLLIGRRDQIDSPRKKERWAAKKSENPFITIRTLDGFDDSNTNHFDNNPMNVTTSRYGNRSFLQIFP